MSAAEPAVLSRPRATTGGDADRRRSAAGRGGWGWRCVLAVALGLRVWGVKQGLPYAYNADENAHFVPSAIGMFGHGWNPHYFVNPPAYTYLLHVVFAVWFGGRARRLARPARRTRPRSSWSRASPPPRSARWRSGCCTWPGRGSSAARPACSPRRCWPSPSCRSSTRTWRSTTCRRWRRSPVAVGHGGRLREGRLRDYLLAGVGLGLACATKYTGGIVLLPLVGGRRHPRWRPGPGARRGARARAGRGRRAGRLRRRQPLRAARPRGVPRRPAAPGRRRRRRAGQARADPEHRATSTTCGRSPGGWAGCRCVAGVVGAGPARGATTGARCSCSSRRRSSSCSSWAPRRASSGAGCCRSSRSSACSAPTRSCALDPARRPARPGAGAGRSPFCGAVRRCCGQGLVYSLHSAMSLSRADTRNTARDWLVDHVPAEHEDRRRAGRPRRVGAATSGTRRRRRPTATAGRSSPPAARTSPRTARSIPGPGRIVNIEDYERTLYPELIDKYEAKGYCWVVVGLDPVRARRGRARRRAAGDRLLPRARAPRDARLRGLARTARAPSR